MSGSGYDEGDQAYMALFEECNYWRELNDYHIHRYNDTVAENNKLLERIELLEGILKEVVDLHASNERVVKDILQIPKLEYTLIEGDE